MRRRVLFHMTISIGPYKLFNQIQTYAWGSRTAIADFLGQPVPSQSTQAELWMGAHPKAPSQIDFEGHRENLDAVISRHPREFLGSEAVSRFGPELPYLFKILAAAQPLSIQAHPTSAQAEAGFARETALGIPLDADHRNYKDNRHKPECICAVTTFLGVCGFRPIEIMLKKLHSVWPENEKGMLDGLSKDPTTGGVRTFFELLMTLAEQRRRDLVAAAVVNASAIRIRQAEHDWMLRLQERYPGDIGVLSPLLLNLFQLRPGEAMFLPAGRLHAYFGGLGIELMANSDNVLRGGLTPKHIDVAQLLRILDFRPGPLEVLTPLKAGPAECHYPSTAEEFILSTIETGNGISHRSADDRRSPDIVLCSHGQATLQCANQPPLTLRKGESALLPVAAGPYTLDGPAFLYKASTNPVGGKFNDEQSIFGREASND